MSIARDTTPAHHVGHIPLTALGLSLSSFFAISFLACILLGVILPDVGLHRPWLQFFPGFEWVTVRGVVIGLIWTQVYGWYTALILGSLFNFFAARFT
ncbi:MAG: hypothetical protein F9K29_10685 [Hyphomicrobiaceae bacterium]|nr:MAG: hypothetical protein F9K29_10685 [Hyphomicrobiaceae bacterium]